MHQSETQYDETHTQMTTVTEHYYTGRASCCSAFTYAHLVHKHDLTNIRTDTQHVEMRGAYETMRKTWTILFGRTWTCCRIDFDRFVYEKSIGEMYWKRRIIIKSAADSKRIYKWIGDITSVENWWNNRGGKCIRPRSSASPACILAHVRDCVTRSGSFDLLSKICRVDRPLKIERYEPVVRRRRVSLFSRVDRKICAMPFFMHRTGDFNVRRDFFLHVDDLKYSGVYIKGYLGDNWTFFLTDPLINVSVLR